MLSISMLERTMWSPELEEEDMKPALFSTGQLSKVARHFEAEHGAQVVGWHKGSES